MTKAGFKVVAFFSEGRAEYPGERLVDSVTKKVMSGAGSNDGIADEGATVEGGVSKQVKAGAAEKVLEIEGQASTQQHAEPSSVSHVAPIAPAAGEVVSKGKSQEKGPEDKPSEDKAPEFKPPEPSSKDADAVLAPSVLADIDRQVDTAAAAKVPEEGGNTAQEEATQTAEALNTQFEDDDPVKRYLHEKETEGA